MPIDTPSPPAPPADPKTSPQEEGRVAVLDRPEADTPWITLVWNDPVNLMNYVTWVFQTHFGYTRSKAETLMMDVHTKGRAVVSTGSREKMEADTEAMHGYGLWATFQKDD
ncbi:ATP-dependent Clp protease adaptor protein ClpS [Serinicoccus hydrothermalis]|uniref:ATP-dependent Clp protease adapter protein ClpS n=1 Tax=Serinicoccus hydrothermalis TaxID=1758689 RepID=A0A1B1NGS8_9MICO|nr:ATP-dependent Clp protease adapter ClpS [Serinicoccus hydrothermalis]ANS80623.1 ATP-dependent Clp protease adaptor protein ClpS [Serinicoccus hydrothermalis]